jgi:outer membrane receptor protein involved in Fe transport
MRNGNLAAMGTSLLILGLQPTLVCAADADSAAAAPAEGAVIEEIVVTAEKRASTVQDTPISLTAVSGADLAARGIVDFSTLAAETPGISMRENGPGQTEFEMRGMTSSGGNSPTVGFYLDDVPMTSPAQAQNGKVVIDPSLYDLNRAEMLRGPQGTLYGAGSMGGTVKLVTNQPDTQAFHVSGDATASETQGGGFNYAVNGMLNLPLIDNQLALRLVGTDSHTSGWIDRIVLSDFPLPVPDAAVQTGNVRGNVLGADVQSDYKRSNDTHLAGARGTLLWQVSDNFTITPSIFYQRVTQDGPSAYDSVPGTLAHYQPFDIAEPYSDEFTLGALTANYHNPGFDLTSVTARWTRTSTQTQDTSESFENPFTCITVPDNVVTPPTGYCSVEMPFYGANGVGSGPVVGTETDPSSQFSEELRVASNGDGPLRGVAGVFYSNFKSQWQLNTQSTNNLSYVDFSDFATPAAVTTVWGLNEPANIRQWAVFGEGTWAITPEFKATAGARLFSYTSDLSMYFAGWGSPLGGATPSTTDVSQKETGVDPKLNLSYEFSSDLMVYATAAKGFRPGGGNQPLPNFPPPNAPANFGYTAWPTTYKSDSLWSYEVGEKARFFERTLTVNASVYYEDWTQIQLEELPFGYPLFDNSGDAKIYGGELELKALLGGGFALSASGAYTHATLTPGVHYTIVLQGQPVAGTGTPPSTPATVVPDVPEKTANIGLDYDHALDDSLSLVAHADYTYTGQRYDLVAINQGQMWSLPGYGLVNLRLGVKSGSNWNAALFCTNLANNHAALENMTALNLANPDFNRVLTNQPRTIGVEFSFKH